MRQAGILAAAGLYALDHMINRLADDHANAKMIASQISQINSPTLNVDYDQVETNIIMINVQKGLAGKICKRFSEVSTQEKMDMGVSTSVLAAPKNDSQIRLVLHCDVSSEMAVRAAQKMYYVAQGKSHKAQHDFLKIGMSQRSRIFVLCL
jgi:threonine aldolase